MRLIQHTAAYWLLWTVRQAIPEKTPLKRAEFTTLQTRLVKIGGRIIETATCIRIAFAYACPDKALTFRLAAAMNEATPWQCLHRWTRQPSGFWSCF
jgi:hypothetical protein